MPGFGSIPAPTARRLLATTEGEVFLRRLYTVPESGQLAAMDSHRRTFTGTLRQMILVRDGACRTPSCGAPIRHLDHVTPYRDGGPTSYENGSGLCVRCNLTKEHPGWSHEATAESLTVTTPTGHRYTRPTVPLLPPDNPADNPTDQPGRAAAGRTVDLAAGVAAVIAGNEGLARMSRQVARGGAVGPTDVSTLVLRRVLGYDGPDHQDAA